MASSETTEKREVAKDDTPTEETPRLYASADLSTNPVANEARDKQDPNLPRLSLDSNPTNDAEKFKGPDFRAPAEVAAQSTSDVPPDKSQEATDVANLFSAIARGDKDQIIALQTKLLGSNVKYVGSYMGQSFELNREKYNEKTHKFYSEGQYLRVGNALVTRANILRGEAKRDVQASGTIVSVARNQTAPESDTSVASGNVQDKKFLNADEQRNKDKKFVTSLLPGGQDKVKKLVEKAQTANAADIKLGIGKNAFEAQVGLSADGTTGTVVGKTQVEKPKPEKVKPTDQTVTQPVEKPPDANLPAGQMETFLRENKDNKAREMVAKLSSGDATTQAKAIQELVSGGVRSISFTRPGEGNRPQEMTFAPATNGRIAVKVDGQDFGRISNEGRLHPPSLSQNLKNLGLDSNGDISIGIKGKEQKIELGKSPTVAASDLVTTGNDSVARPALTPEQMLAQATPEQKLKQAEVLKVLNAQGYVQQNQVFKPNDMIVSIRPDGQAAQATITGIDADGKLMVQDTVSNQTVKIEDWDKTVNPGNRNLTVMMRKMPDARTELPPIQHDIALRTAPHMTGAKLASQAASVRDTDQVGALKKILAPFDVNLSDAKNATQIADQLSSSNRFMSVLPSTLKTSSDQPQVSEPTLPGDVHILAPKNQVTNGDTFDWNKRNSPGMVLGITNERGEMVNVTNGERLDPTQFVASTFRPTSKPELAPPLEASVVYGRLFPSSENADAVSSQPKSIQDVENALKKTDSKFTPAGQINTSDLASKLPSMEVGTTILLSGTNPNDKRVAVVGEIPAGPNSNEQIKVLFSSDGSGRWDRIDDAGDLQRTRLSSAEIFKPKEAVNLAAPAEANPEFERMLGQLTEKAFYARQLVGDPRAKEKFYSAIKSGALPLDALKRYISDDGDVHSDFQTNREVADMKAKTSGFGGLGIEFGADKSQIQVIDVFKNSAAERAVLAGTNTPFALKTGDIIKSVNGQSLEGKPQDEAANMLRGPINTKVEVEIQRPKDGSPGQFENFKVSMVRALVIPPSVQTSMDNTGIVHIRMNSGFNEQTANQFKSEIERIKAEKGNEIKGFVLDMRNNPGGLLDQSLSIISAFAPMNSAMLVVRERSGGTKDNPQYKSYEYRLTEKGVAKVPMGHKGEIPSTMIDPRVSVLPRNLIDKPVSVLVNSRSASASEVVASALQDYGVATYGTNTFGKGSVQTLIEEKRMRITTAQYLSPLSHKWVGNWPNPRANRDPQNPDSTALGPRGLQPDIEVRAKVTNFKIGSAEDNQISDVRKLMLRNMLAR